MVEAAAMLAAIAEDAQARRLAGDPGVTINDVVRADGAARRAVRDLALPDERAEPPAKTLAEHLAEKRARAAEAATLTFEPSATKTLPDDAVAPPEGMPP
jgi:hypothetical protein